MRVRVANSAPEGVPAAFAVLPPSTDTGVPGTAAAGVLVAAAVLVPVPAAVTISGLLSALLMILQDEAIADAGEVLNVVPRIVLPVVALAEDIDERSNGERAADRELGTGLGRGVTGLDEGVVGLADLGEGSVKCSFWTTFAGPWLGICTRWLN